MKQRFWLLAGDLLALAAFTLLGFATHGETGLQFLPRMATTFLPALAAWMLVAWPLQVYNLSLARQGRNLWRPLYAMCLAGPLAVLLRALWLQGVVIPIFGVVFTATGALALFLWRALWLWISNTFFKE